MDVMVERFKLARTLAATKALAQYRGAELHQGADTKDEAGMRAHIAKFTETLYHPVGTCKMGNDNMAVVDSELCVHGVEGLRLVDASIMPTVVGGNTNAPTIILRRRRPISSRTAQLRDGRKVMREALRRADRFSLRNV